MLALLPQDDPRAARYFGRKGDPYRPEAGLISAANTALALGMPLLLTGEPGCGKTDFAFVAARWLAEQEGVRAWSPGDREHGLLDCYIRSDTRSRDLLYSYDALRRFGDAHHGGDAGRLRAADPRNYIALEGLGRALDSPRRRVVLVDEIDKAPRDLPNDLLRELDQGEFEIAEIPVEPGPVAEDPRRLERKMGKADRSPELKPLIVVTSNAERQLPDPFLRRCIFYHLAFPDRTRLLRMLEDRFGRRGTRRVEGAPADVEETVLKPAVVLFEQLRQNQGLIKRPATSELLAWVEAILRLASEAERRLFASIDVADVPWREVPRLECLIKLREDLETLKVRPA